MWRKDGHCYEINNCSFFILIWGSVFLGCKSGKHLVSDSHTQIIVHDKLVPVFRPADSASIRALLECDSNGRVMLSWLDMARSENARLRFQLDSMGNLLADFKVPSDTVFIPGKDKYGHSEISANDRSRKEAYPMAKVLHGIHHRSAYFLCAVCSVQNSCNLKQDIIWL